MSEIAGSGGMGNNAPKSMENKFNGRNFTYKARQSKFEERIDALRGQIYDFNDSRQASWSHQHLGFAPCCAESDCHFCISGQALLLRKINFAT